MSTTVSKDHKLELKDIQIPIPEYPKFQSSHLIDYFLIYGYEEEYIQNQIIKKIPQSQDTKLTSFPSTDYPTILSSISSDYNDDIINENEIINSIYPSSPLILYSKGGEIFSSEIENKKVIFTKIENNIINYGFALTFYEQLFIFNDKRIFLPKAFVIISQYPYFNTFNNILNEIYNLFHCNTVQIPIEIQIYNIINFLPAPISKNYDISIFPNYNLEEIIKCNSNEEFISLDNQEIYSLEKNKGYKKPEINMTEIFQVIPIEILVHVYLEILTGSVISIFSENIEILKTVIFLFQTFMFPLVNEENVKSLSPDKYFCKSENKNNIFGFLCCYENVNQYNKNGNNNFKSEFIFDIDKKEINSNETLREETKKLNEYFKNIINKESNENNSSEFEKNIRELIKKLKEIKEKIVKFGKNKNEVHFFDYINNEQDELNKLIQGTFYQFILSVSSHYVFKYLMNNDNNDIEEEKIFYNLFSKSIYSKNLNNLKTNYLSNNDNINKKNIVIFENVLLAQNKNNSQIMEKINDINFLTIFYKEKDVTEPITFLEFYKYYFNNLQTYFYEVINDKFVNCKQIKNENSTNFLYHYKKINLDKELIFKYIYLLEQMPSEDKIRCFPSNIEVINKVTHNIKEIQNNFEQYYIENNLIDFKDVIKLSILIIVSLSTSGHKLIYFAESIYELLNQIKVSLYKYIEIILYIAYKVFTKETNKNLYIYEKYFDIFKAIKENSLIIINNDLNILYENISKFCDKIKGKRNENINEDEGYKIIKDLDIKKLYTIECKLKEKEIINSITSANFNESIKKSNLNFKAKILKDKAYSFSEIASPYKIYTQLNKMLEGYLKKLDFGKVNKEEYKKLIMQLIYYCNMFQDDFPKDVIKFLVYCLKTENK